MAALAWHLVWVFSVAMVLVLTLRRPLRRWLGPGQAYAFWALVPAMCAAALLRAPWSVPSILDAPAQLANSFVLPMVSARAVPRNFPWWGVVLAIWAVGVLVRSLVGAFRVLQVRRGLHRLSPEGEAEWRQRMRTVRPHGRLPRPMQHVLGPALFGCFRPVLLLPPDAGIHWSRVQADLVLRHELVHYRRRDNAWNLLAGLLGTLFWWHPLTAFAWRRFRLDQELACDRAVLAGRPERVRAYGQALIESHGGARIAMASHWVSKPQLRERIRMIGSNQSPLRRRRVGALLLGLGIAAMAVAAPRHALVPLQAASGQAPASSSTAEIPPKALRAFNRRLRPRYPASAIKGKQQGMVVVLALVGKQGHVIRTRLTGDAPVYPTLAQSTIDFVSQMRYRPATLHGKPVAAWVRVPVTYSLNEKN